VLHFRRYIAALAVLLAAFGLYYVLIAPWVEPPPVRRAAAADGHKPVQASPNVQAELSRLFPQGAWELDPATKVIETEQCTLLIRDYLPTPDGRLELKPCTLIFYAKGSSADENPLGIEGPITSAPRRPIVLQAPAGAVIQFDRPLNLGRGDFGQIVGGRLAGEITIFSPPSASGDDGLRLVTREVQLGRDSLFTTEDVEFHYGKSFGRGRDLTIVFLRDSTNSSASSNAPAFDGIRSITLAHIDRIRIAAGGSGSLGGPLGGRDKSKSGDDVLEITCQGPFEFDFLNQVAVFDEKVEVFRLVPGSAPDRLRCDQLLLELAPKSDDDDKAKTDALPSLQPAPENEAPPTGEAQPSADSANKRPLPGRLQRIIALGSPAVLESPSSGAKAVACRMEYSLARQRIVLVPGKNAPQVSLRHQSQEFIARELEYEFAETGRIGRLWAAGPGQIRATQESSAGPKSFFAHWEKELRIRPHEGNQVISLIGGAVVGSKELGRFDADELHLWVREVAGDDDGNGNKRSPAIVPGRMLATGQVHVQSPKLLAHTGRLEVWFTNLPAEPAGPLPASQPFAPQPHPHAQPQPNPHAQPNTALDSPPPPKPQQFRVLGDLIQMQIHVQGNKTAGLEALTIRGRATIDETHTPEPGQEPIHIAGNLIELHRGTTRDAQVEVSGQNAELGGRGISLVGGTIHLRRGENRAWIDGPGEATLPVPAGQGLALGPGALSPPAEPVRQPVGQPKKLHVTWRDGLTFDGQTVHLEGEIEARTQTQLILARTLDATLSRTIDFNEPQNRQAVDLARLHLDGGVSVKNSTFDELGAMTAFDEMKFKNLTLDRGAGKLFADGPGWVSSVRSGPPGGAGQGFPALGPVAAGPVAPGKEKPLTSIHIQFEKRIEGTLAERRIEFQRNVRTTYSPARDFADRIVATRPADLGERGVLLASDTLALTEMLVTGQKWFEMEASDALIEGRTFTIRAAKVRYAGDKEVLTIEGNGRTDAEIWHQSVPGEPRTYTSARKLRYWLRDGTFDGEDFNTFDLQQIGPRVKLPLRRR
jgi:hypothetical protein